MVKDTVEPSRAGVLDKREQSLENRQSTRGWEGARETCKDYILYILQGN